MIQSYNYEKLPIIHTRADAVSEVMKSSTISHDNLHVEYFTDQFGYLMAVIAYPQVLEYAYRHARVQAQEPKSNGYSLTRS